LERSSEHPLGAAIVRAAEERGVVLERAREFMSYGGRGAEAEVDGRAVLAGNRALMDERGVDVAPLVQAAERMAAAGRTPVYVAVDGAAQGVLAIADPVKPGSAAAVRALRALGLDVVMLTGDTERTALAIAREVGIERVLAGVRPAGKVEEVKRLQAAGAGQTADIRKFEEVGTMPAAPHAAIAEALAFHQAIGIERKAARLRYLTLRWANALKGNPRIRIHSSLEPGQTWGLALVGVDGIQASALSQFLMDKYRVIVVAIAGGAPPSQVFDFQGLRVTPNVYTTLEEIDTFVTGMQDALQNGVPGAAKA